MNEGVPEQEAYCRWGSSKHIAGLWKIRMDGAYMEEPIETKIWLEAGGSFNSIDESFKNMGGQSFRSNGLWAMENYGSAITLRTAGNPCWSLRGNLPPSSRDLEAAEESEDAERLIAGHVEEGSELDPEFVGRFEMVQTVSANPEEPLLLPPEERPHRKYSPFKPVFHQSALLGAWTFAGTMDDSPMLFSLELSDDGKFQSSPTGGGGGGGGGGSDRERLLAGRWGVFSDEELHPNEAQRRKKESLGTHLWLWVQRRACRGFSLQSDLRMHGRIAPLIYTDSSSRSDVPEKATSSSSSSSGSAEGKENEVQKNEEGDERRKERRERRKRREERKVSGGGSSGGGSGGECNVMVVDGGDFDATSIEDELSLYTGGLGGASGGGGNTEHHSSNQRVMVQGFILWGESSDMEYSSLVGKFTLTPTVSFE